MVSQENSEEITLLLPISLPNTEVNLQSSF
jgi:hypothetical protein